MAVALASGKGVAYLAPGEDFGLAPQVLAQEQDDMAQTCRSQSSSCPLPLRSLLLGIQELPKILAFSLCFTFFLFVFIRCLMN